MREDPASSAPKDGANPSGVASDSGNLDLLRSLAVLFVVISHLPAAQLLVTAALGSGSMSIQPLGLVGVGIFFVHTCLVLLYSIERQTAATGRVEVAGFYIRRIFRIYPLSIVTVLAVTTTELLRSESAFSTWALVNNLLLTQNISGHASTPGPLWTLPYEVQMYLALPAIFLLVKGRRRTAAIYACGLFASAVALVYLFWRLGLNYHLVKYLPCFIAGVLAFSLRGEPERLPPQVLFGYVGLVALMFPWLVDLGMKENVAIWPVLFGLGLLIPFSSEVASAPLRGLGRVVARYSYGIYLAHAPFISLAFGRLDLATPWRWLLFLGGTSATAFIAFHLIERPFIDYGKKLAHSRRIVQARDNSTT